VRIGESHALRCEPIEMRRWDFAPFRIHRVEITVPKIVRQDIDNVRSLNALQALVGGCIFKRLESGNRQQHNE
jgi:hypothetical protein